MLHKFMKQFAVGVLMTTVFATASSADDLLDQIENAHQADDHAALTKLVKQAEGNNKYVAQYRLAGLHLGDNRIAEAKKLLNDLKASLEEETSANPDNAEAWALLANIFGMLTTMEQDKAMEYGQQAGAAERRALAVGEDNPMVLLLTGINKFYTPEKWGGGKVKASEYFDRAVAAYQAGDLERSWGHVDALVWRGSAHAKLGNIEQAEADLNAAIAMEPDYQWAKNALDSL